MKHKGLTFLTIFHLIASDFIEALIMFSFKKVSMLVPEEATASALLSNVAPLLSDVVQSPFLWLGMLGMVSSFIVWSAVLSNITTRSIHFETTKAV